MHAENMHTKHAHTGNNRLDAAVMDGITAGRDAPRGEGPSEVQCMGALLHDMLIGNQEGTEGVVQGVVQ